MSFCWVLHSPLIAAQLEFMRPVSWLIFIQSSIIFLQIPQLLVESILVLDLHTLYQIQSPKDNILVDIHINVLLLNYVNGYLWPVGTVIRVTRAQLR